MWKDEFYVTELQEYELYFETIVVGDRMFMTIDISKYADCDIFVRFYSTHFVIWIRGSPLEVNYPKGIVIDPDSVVRVRRNGLIDVEAKVVRKSSFFSLIF